MNISYFRQHTAELWADPATVPGDHPVQWQQPAVRAGDVRAANVPAAAAGGWAVPDAARAAANADGDAAANAAADVWGADVQADHHHPGDYNHQLQAADVPADVPAASILTATTSRENTNLSKSQNSKVSDLTNILILTCLMFL